MYLGIDQSFTSAGYCLIDKTGVVLEFGVIKTSKNDGDKYERAHIITNKMIELVNTHKPLQYGVEGLAFGGVGNATRDLAGLQYVLITRLRYNTDHGDNLCIIPPTDLKKFATNKGGAKKEQMIDNLPQDFKDRIAAKNYRKTTGLGDIADAYWIAQYILHKNRA